MSRKYSFAMDFDRMKDFPCNVDQSRSWHVPDSQIDTEIKSSVHFDHLIASRVKFLAK